MVLTYHNCLTTTIVRPLPFSTTTIIDHCHSESSKNIWHTVEHYHKIHCWYDSDMAYSPNHHCPTADIPWPCLSTVSLDHYRCLVIIIIAWPLPMLDNCHHWFTAIAWPLPMLDNCHHWFTAITWPLPLFDSYHLPLPLPLTTVIIEPLPFLTTTITCLTTDNVRHCLCFTTTIAWLDITNLSEPKVRTMKRLLILSCSAYPVYRNWLCGSSKDSSHSFTCNSPRELLMAPYSHILYMDPMKLKLLDEYKHIKPRQKLLCASSE